MDQSQQNNQPLRVKTDWKRLLDEWKFSGLNQVDFCKTKEIKLPTFVYWRSKLKRKSQSAPIFQAINIASAAHAQGKSPSPTLRLPNGISLSVMPDADSASLSETLYKSLKRFKNSGLETFLGYSILLQALIIP